MGTPASACRQYDNAGIEHVSDTDEDDSDDDDFDEDDTSTRQECMKLLFLLGIIAIVIVLADEVGDLLLSTQSFLRQIPLVLGLPVIVLGAGLRRLAPPIYYIAPIGTLSLLYLLRFGAYRAACIYQAVKMLDTVWFLGIRYYYASFMDALVDPNAKEAGHFVPHDILRGLRGLDREWAHRIRGFGIRGFATIVVLGCAWGTDELVTLYFLCTRCGLTISSFGLGWLGVQTALLPENIVRAFALETVAADFTNVRAIRRGLLLTPIWILLLWAVIAIATTLLVHAVHVRLLSSEFRARGLADSAPSPNSSIRREQRRVELTAQQQTELEESSNIP